MANQENKGFATRAIHAGQQPDEVTGAIMTPVFQTSTYVQKSPGAHTGYEYSRTGNPTRTALEANLASLEGGNHGLCFSSGCAALTALLHLYKPGDHIVVSDDVYGGTHRIFNQIFKPMGIEFSLVDMTDVSSFANAIQANTKLIWVETPTNPMLKVVDIEAIASKAKQINKDILVAVDNTFATPYLQNPLKLGADIVCHSTTKYLGGHSDVVGGALIVNDKALSEQLHFVQNAVGAVPAPMDCFLVLRSTKTLAVRMKQHCENAKAIAEFLANHPKVETVIYPGLTSHPQHDVAKKQMHDYGGMISILMKGDIEASRQFLEKVQLFSLAESLGGVESLIEHPAIMTHAAIPAEQRRKLGIDDSLVRLSVGIEDIDDLKADLEQALS